VITEGRAIKKRIDFDGLKISIEVVAGGFRTGVSKSGMAWKQPVSSDYGYILNTHSPDGEHLDCWVKKNPKESSRVYVVHQLSVDGKKFDEDKVMLGFSSAEQAISEFKKHCYKPTLMYGGYSEFSMEHFKVVAYASRNSTVMIASEKVFQRFVEKGLLPRGIKSPIQISQIVKETTNMALHVSYKNQLIAESALDLAVGAGLNALKANTDVIFETEADLNAFITLIDALQENKEHLGDLYEVLPEDFEMVVESNLSDAVDDLKSELRADDGDAFAVADSIARDYGLTTEDLIKAFENAVKMPVSQWAAHRDDMRRNQQNAKQAQEKIAADAKAEKQAAAAAKRKANSPQMKMYELVQYVMDRIGSFIPDGDPTDAVIDGLYQMGIDRHEYYDKYEPYFTKQFKAATGYSTPYDYAASLMDDLVRDNPEVYDRNPYRESIEDIMLLAGVKTAVMEQRGTPLVHTTKIQVERLNEAHNNALRKFMINYAAKKQRTVMEAVEGVDMDAVLRRFGNTLLANRNVHATHIAEKVAERLLNGNIHALKEYVSDVSGLSFDGFAQAVRQRTWNENRISRQEFGRIMEATESNWNLDCPDRGTAFTKACL
jgi:hypothetical protein